MDSRLTARKRFSAKPYTWKRSPMARTQFKRVHGTPMKRSTLKSKGDSPALKKVKAQARLRDDYTCQYPGCDYRSKSIDVHHIAKRSQRPDLRLELSNLICLCRKHHARTDTHRSEAEALGLVGGESYEKARKAA
jgi:5-methylcytosine-specific restriction endonuclease McrA